MNTETIQRSKGPTRDTKFPWKKWLSGSFENPVTLTFGKEIPATKSPAVFATQLHQWARIFKLWAFTSVHRGAKSTTIAIYVEPRKNNKRPDSKFPYPKAEIAVAKKKAVKKPAKSAKKKPAKTKK